MDHATARAAPEVSVAISPLLRRLRGGQGTPPHDHGACGTARPDGPRDLGPQVPSARDQAAVEQGDGVEAAAPGPEAGPDFRASVLPHHARAISLRRDGLRPLRFTGLPLLRCQTLTRLDDAEDRARPALTPDGDVAEAVQRLDIYMDTLGALVVATSVDFRGSVAARPHYRATRVAAPGDLAAFVTDHCAGSGLLGLGATHQTAAAARRLADAFRAMLRDSGLSIPDLEEDIHG